MKKSVFVSVLVFFGLIGTAQAETLVYKSAACDWLPNIYRIDKGTLKPLNPRRRPVTYVADVAITFGKIGSEPISVDIGRVEGGSFSPLNAVNHEGIHAMEVLTASGTKGVRFERNFLVIDKKTNRIQFTWQQSKYNGTIISSKRTCQLNARSVDNLIRRFDRSIKAAKQEWAIETRHLRREYQITNWEHRKNLPNNR